MPCYKPSDDHWQSRLAAIEGRPQPEPVDVCTSCGNELQIDDQLEEVCNTCAELEGLT